MLDYNFVSDVGGSSWRASGRLASRTRQLRRTDQVQTCDPAQCFPRLDLDASYRSLRRECVDHLIVLGGAHLRRVLTEFAAYYNASDSLRLDKDAPFHRAIQSVWYHHLTTCSRRPSSPILPGSRRMRFSVRTGEQSGLLPRRAGPPRPANGAAPPKNRASVRQSCLRLGMVVACGAPVIEHFNRSDPGATSHTHRDFFLPRLLGR